MTRIKWIISNAPFEELVMIASEKDIAYICQTYWIKGYDKEDLAQELRFHLWKKLYLYNPTKSRFRTWAKEVMMNRLRNLTIASHREKREIQHNLTSLENLPDEVSNCS